MLSRKLKGVFRHHYFPNIDRKWEHESNSVGIVEKKSFIWFNLDQIPFYLILFYLFYSDPLLKNNDAVQLHVYK